MLKRCFAPAYINETTTVIGIALPGIGAALASVRVEWPLRRLGPYSCVAGFFLLGVLALTVCRVALAAWQWTRVDATDVVFLLLLQGLRNDLMTLSILAAPVVLVLPLFAALRGLRVWVRWSSVWLALCLVLVLILEFATPQFMIEFDTRPNRLFIEYLVYPKEVSAMLWNGYRGLLCASVVAVSVLGWGVVRHFRRYARQPLTWRTRIVLWLWPLVVIALFAMIRSSVQHRPANIASFALSDDAMVNSLVINSTYSVLSAVYTLKNESQSSEMYGNMPVDDMVRIVRHGMAVPATDFTSPEFPTLHKQLAAVRRAAPLNLVLILEESMGAGFVKSLGGQPITPNLDKLVDQGIWFDRLYATGTRSVRGIEAVVAGFPPTPALSVVKLSKAQQDFATLASVLRRAGYSSEFVYGGESHFDNMRGFFLGNGFHSVVERKDFKAPKFVGSWGVSDEDLFDKADQRIRKLNAAREPFFMLVFSSSNHTPFEFPDGRIELVDAEKQTVNNAVKYADYALGKFIDRARSSDYWNDTVFLVVADHDTRVYGDELVPISKFHIPGVILGADVQPRRIESIVSQIDLAPTLLSFLGIDSEHPFPGRDLTRTLPEFGNVPAPLPPRAMMQFDRNYAWLQDERVTVLLPDGERRQFAFERRSGALEPLPQVDETVARQALANVLMPAWLYRERRYRLPP